MNSLHRHLPRIAAWLLLLVALWMLVPGAGHAASATQGAGTTIFVEGVSVAPGERATTSILLRTDALTLVTNFTLDVSYDDTLLRADSVNLDPLWDPGPDEAVLPNTVHVAGVSPEGCQPGNSCRLAEIEWTGLVAGTGRVQVQSASLSNGGDAVTFSVTEGGVGVAEPLDLELGPPNDGLGFGTGFTVIAWMVIAGIAVSAPIVWLVFRVKGNRRATPKTAVPAGSAVAPQLAEELTAALSLYLSAYETGAQVDAQADPLYDRMAREAAGPTRARTDDRLAVDDGRPNLRET